MLTAGVRISVRMFAERPRPGAHKRKRTLIYGAGNAGAALLRDLRQNIALPYDIKGFLDDNPRKLGLVLNGIKVLGNGGALETIVTKHDIEIVLIALPPPAGPR